MAAASSVNSSLWQRLESGYRRPSRCTGIKTVEWRAFAEADGGGLAHALINDLYAGRLLLLKGAFPAEWMRDLKRKTIEWCRDKPSEFHKMLEGSPDFHRVIDEETGKHYSIRGSKHSAYFYTWNSDPLQILPFIYERWSPIKVLMGLKWDEYIFNTPKDGVVDRVQVVRYPPGAGYLEPHSDPYLHQRLFISGYMSKRGVDYRGGGFYLVGPDDEMIEVEDQIEVGDVALGYATVMHGVAPCEGKCHWELDDGRWFLSLYSNATDYVEDRHTARPEKLNLPGVVP